MKVITAPALMQRYSNRLKRQGKKIGFVPTMGFLHDGHLSLVKRSLKENDATVVSIFVNPAQFGPGEDFRRYPRNFKKDKAMLMTAGADVIFYPAANSMYPHPYLTYVDVEGLTRGLCGKSRPVHFRGVATVVAKLFNIVKPDTAYFGQKDAQQALVIKKMAQDLNMDLKVRIMPIVREKSGLAMSSRNKYLSPKEKKEALVLYRALKSARQLIKKGETDPEKVISEMRKIIKNAGSVRIDYIEITDSGTLEPLKKITGAILIALAVHIGKTRLIDNIKLITR